MIFPQGTSTPLVHAHAGRTQCGQRAANYAALSWRPLPTSLGVEEMFGVATGIWKVPAYLPYVHDPVSDGIVKGAETQLGVSLPPSYVNLISEQNGGYVRRILPETPHRMIWGIGPEFPSITESHRTLRRRARRGRRFWAKTLPLVPIDGDGHWYLCLDYRAGTTEPSVIFVDLEIEEERVVADTFEGFLSLLQLDVSRTALGIVGDWTADSAAQTLGIALGVSFENQGTWAHGYATWRCSLSDDRNPQWCWISPNEVPRGFIREDHERFQKLNDRMPGSAKRFPEFPDVTVVISSTEGVSDVVRGACLRAFGHVVSLAAPG